MTAAGVPGDDAAQMAHEEAGLYWLGVRADSDSSVFHRWGSSFPPGMFDGHQSVMPAPDHLLFLGLTKKLVQCVFTLLPVRLRSAVGLSFREALAHAGYSRVHVYNSKKKPELINNLGISQWAAALTIAPHAVNRVVSDNLLVIAPCTTSARGPLLTPLGVAVDLLHRLRVVACCAIFYPLAEVDGVAACQARGANNSELHRLTADFLRSVRGACLRADCSRLLSIFDVPNLHRLSELIIRALFCFGHIRDILELLFESSHQPLKRAIARGNGLDDAYRAMSSVVETEIISRVKLDPSFFSIPAPWLLHRSMGRLQRQALPLWSLPRPAWCVGRTRARDGPVPDFAQLAVANHGGCPGLVSWRKTCQRGDGEVLCAGDAVAVLVVSDFAVTHVHTVRSGEEALAGVHVSFFRVVAIFAGVGSFARAVVHPFVPSGAPQVHTLNSTSSLLLDMARPVRKAMALHDCTGLCQPSDTRRIEHDATNSWLLYGRREGYPARSG